MKHYKSDWDFGNF